MLIVIRGRIPSKKNSRNIFVRHGKLFNIPSKRYKEWHSSASEQLIQQVKNIKEITPKTVVLTFYAPDKRVADLTNKTESVMDLLVDNGVFKDDNWWVIKELVLKFGGLDRNEPRCEIAIV